MNTVVWWVAIVIVWLITFALFSWLNAPKYWPQGGSEMFSWSNARKNWRQDDSKKGCVPNFAARLSFVIAGGLIALLVSKDLFPQYLIPEAPEGTILVYGQALLCLLAPLLLWTWLYFLLVILVVILSVLRERLKRPVPAVDQDTQTDVLNVILRGVALIAGALLVFSMAIYLLHKQIVAVSVVVWWIAIVFAWLITIALFRWLFKDKTPPQGDYISPIAGLLSFLVAVGLMALLIPKDLIPEAREGAIPVLVYALLLLLTLMLLWTWLNYLLLTILSVPKTMILYGVAQGRVPAVDQDTQTGVPKVILWGVALIAGALLGFLTAIYVVMIIMDSLSPGGFLLAFLGGWAISTYLLLRKTRTVSNVISRTFLLGAAQSVVLAVALLFPTIPADGADAIGYVAIAIGMILVFLLGWVITGLITGLWRKRAGG